MGKSYVTLEQAVCPICAETKDTGNLLLDRRMRDTFEHKTTTGVDICPDCQKMIDDGYIALVGADEKQSVISHDNRIKVEDAFRLAEYLWIKRHVAVQIFDTEFGEHPFVFIDQEAIDKVKEIVANAEDQS